MKKFTLIYMLVAVCALLLTSCEPSDVSGSGEFSVSLRNPKVASDAGTQFLDVKCSGDWTLALVADGTEEVDWASLSVYSGTGDKANVRFTYKTNSTEVERSLTIYLDNGSKSVFCTFTQHAGEYRPDDGPEDDEQTPSGGVDLTKTGWIELPAMDDPDLGYFTHSFKMNGKNYRNYSFGWSQKDYTAVWVAYPLCSVYTNKGVERTNKWAYNPVLGPELSPAPFDGYAGSYDRGHLLPSADRLCCYDANVQTFYSTNIVPQDAKHNQNAWESLEGMIRNIANKSDTTYVVTGVMIKNPIGYTTDSTKDEFGQRRNESELKTLPVPSHFFKAVLRYSKASTLGQWNAAGFYYTHESQPQQQLISIDKLEELTGIDFFVNLASVVGEDMAANIESSTPSTSIWK
jgi:DNA/RNA endonuclease G (NUC1)/predicted small secreted protein